MITKFNVVLEKNNLNTSYLYKKFNKKSEKYNNLM